MSESGTPTRADLAQKILAAPDRIETAESAVLAASEDLYLAEERLKTKEHALLTARLPSADGIGKPLLDGSNTETRKAQLWALTSEERLAVARAEAAREAARACLNRERNRFSSYKAAGRLLDPEER